MNNLNDIFFAPAANQDLTYDQVLEDVQRYFAENHASTIAEAGEGNAERATTLLKELMVQYIVKRKYAIEGLTTEELCEKLYEDMAGYSFLKKWIYKPGIEEVNINAYNDIEVIEAGGRSIKIPDKFSSPQHAIDVVRRMLNACGMVIDDTMPSVVGFLDKNIRISVDKTPIVDPDVGINASIPKHGKDNVTDLMHDSAHCYWLFLARAFPGVIVVNHRIHRCAAPLSNLYVIKRSHVKNSSGKAGAAFGHMDFISIEFPRLFYGRVKPKVSVKLFRGRKKFKIPHLRNQDDCA